MFKVQKETANNIKAELREIVFEDV
jgi:hypothetical protein